MPALLDGYTGARWSELVGRQPHEYDEINKAIRIAEPLAEARGRLVKVAVLVTDACWSIPVSDPCAGSGAGCGWRRPRARPLPGGSIYRWSSAGTWRRSWTATAASRVLHQPGGEVAAPVRLRAPRLASGLRR
ncbi:hypothetical protein [Actinomadura rubrisoli]|uniref:Uncharacterized protein n=1 Tax=Actinomadura rubrisoli TaxID=2530368 RepID=A0A4R5CHL0_9ACTN|nr:hypothetical protein [Actinomadura rubrisoli]TDD96782.1 hypothetical protein E1298_02025 [Actinomadura rubrisoli]